jgi:hypothetical protein
MDRAMVPGSPERDPSIGKLYVGSRPLNAVPQVLWEVRDRREYGRRLLSILCQHGNFAARLVCLPFHLVYRLYAWMAGLNVTARQPVESGVASSGYLMNERAIWGPL